MSCIDLGHTLKNYCNWTAWSLHTRLIALLLGYSILVMGEFRFGIWPTLQEQQQLQTQVEELDHQIQSIQLQIKQVQLKNKASPTQKTSSAKCFEDPIQTQMALLETLVTSAQARGVQILKVRPEQLKNDLDDQSHAIQVSVRAPTFVLFEWADHFFKAFPALIQHVLFLIDVDQAQFESQRILRAEFLVQGVSKNKVTPRGE